jgi:Ca2+-binding EF-hand superfamily protein
LLDKQLENFKIELALKEDFNLIDAFALIDYRGRGYVTVNELLESLKDLGCGP